MLPEGHIRAVFRDAKIPALTANSALFLDIDGTLLDIAPAPDAVRVPDGLPSVLQRLVVRLGGAVALLSGRALSDIDRFFGGLRLAVGAEHGSILRDGGGLVREGVTRPEALDGIVRTLRAAIAARPGTLLEEKRFGIAIHWRAAPAHAAALRALATDLAAATPGLVLLPAHEAVEVRVAGADKGAALEAMMREPPFAGRLPAFIGDDVTDEPAMAAAARLGGFGLHVARDFGGSTQAVRDWLAENGHA